MYRVGVKGIRLLVSGLFIGSGLAERSAVNHAPASLAQSAMKCTLLRRRDSASTCRPCDVV